MIANFRPAAYHGSGWLPREGTLAEEIAGVQLWNNCSVSSEWQTLKEVILYIPNPGTPSVEDVDSIQHLDDINFWRLASQLKSLAQCYEQFGIKVHFVRHVRLSNEPTTEYYYNLMFCRDLFFMTHEGAIVSRMGSRVRAGEEKHAARTLADLGIPIVRTISGNGTFEGADALWVSPNLVVIGVGKRTNESGFQQVQHCLEAQGVTCIKVNLPPQIQHTLGILQMVDHNLAVVRGQLLAPETKAHLRQLGFKLIELEETKSVRQNQAMNFVTISPRRIVMVAGNPETKRLYEENGIEVAAEVDVSELLKGAGGIGCATGILSRKSD
jgi:N-dimethylarginine dimethylaminohydrolase